MTDAPADRAPTGATLLELVAVMDRLRSPGGCPWDAEQTHASLVPHLLEESYEVADAVARGARRDLLEELGDVLLQVVFHSRIAQEDPEDPWDIDDVAAGLVAKLVRRHPHVFEDTQVSGAAEVSANWDRIKQAEKSRESVTDGIPTAQPALALYAALWRRGVKSGLLGGAAEPSTGDVGERLAAAVRDAVDAGVDPDAALREQAHLLRERILDAEASAGAEGRRGSP